MASVASSLRSLPPLPPLPPRPSPSSNLSKGVLQCRSRLIHPSEKGHTDQRKRISFDGTKRREALLQIFLSAVSFPFRVTDAAAETDLEERFRTYEDEDNKFRISIPQGWLVGTGEPNGFKSVTAFYPGESSDSNVSVVITGLGPDFTKLESFGTVDAFAENLVSGLDRSWTRPPGLAAKLINSKAANGLYYIEYTLQNPGERCRHVLSAIGTAFNGWYNRLYTVTGQFMEDESEKFRPQIEKAISSFRLI